MNLGEKLFELRKSKNLTQDDVAEKLDVTRQTVSKWETNQSTPDFDKIAPLCKLYEITPNELLIGETDDAQEDNNKHVEKKNLNEVKNHIFTRGKDNPKESYENCFGHYIKYAMRNAMDIATLGTSVNVRLSADKKTVERARVAFGVAGPVPLRAETAERFAAGQPVSLELAERFAQAVKEDINPRDSWRAARDFRLHIAVESAKRAFIESVKLAGGDL